MRGSRVVFVWALLFVAALAVAIVPLAARVRQSTRSHDRAGREQAWVQRTDDADVAGFTGEIESPSGMRLSVRLARLHAGERQQKFDANALARRFGLGEGEPFVCEISARGEGSIAADALGSISVRDENGVALTPFAPVTATTKTGITDTEPTDPLMTLLAPPAQELRAGFAVSVILWGRAPTAGAFVSGLSDVDVALAPKQLAPRDLDAALARIDAPSATGTGAPK